MSLFDSPDLFTFFRWALGTVVTIYATIVTAQSLWSWWVWLATDDRHIRTLRNYVFVHGLRLRFRTFWGDVIVCVLLCVVFLMLTRANWIVAHTPRNLSAVPS